MNAKEARQIAEAHTEVVLSIALTERLIQSEAERGKFQTKIDIHRDIMNTVRDHFASRGFGIKVTSAGGVYTLHLNW